MFSLFPYNTWHIADLVSIVQTSDILFIEFDLENNDFEQ